MTGLPFSPPPGWYKRVGAASAGGKVGALLERAKGEFSERSPSSPTTETDSVTENPPSFTRCAPPLPVDGNLGFWAGIRSPVLGAVVGVCADFVFFSRGEGFCPPSLFCGASCSSFLRLFWAQDRGILVHVRQSAGFGVGFRFARFLPFLVGCFGRVHVVICRKVESFLVLGEEYKW